MSLAMQKTGNEMKLFKSKTVEAYEWSYVQDECRRAIEGFLEGNTAAASQLSELVCDRVYEISENADDVVMEIIILLNDEMIPELSAVQKALYLKQALALFLKTTANPEETLAGLQEIEKSVRELDSPLQKNCSRITDLTDNLMGTFIAKVWLPGVFILVLLSILGITNRSWEGTLLIGFGTLLHSLGLL